MSTTVAEPDGATRVRRTPFGLAGVLTRELVGFALARPPASLDVLPTPSATLMVQMGAPFRDTPDLFVSGLTTTPIVAHPSGPIRCVDVKLAPVACRRLLGVQMHELTDTVVPLEDLMAGADVRRLREAAVTTQDWSVVLGSVESLLVDAVTGPDDTDRALQRCWDELGRSGGRVRVEEVAAGLGWTHRRLDRCFRERVGVGPKMAARLFRLERTLALLNGSPHRPLAEVAAVAGFSDQAHMTNEIVALTGQTPRKIRSSG